jgi:hypothetical protein
MSSMRGLALDLRQRSDQAGDRREGGGRPPTRIVGENVVYESQHFSSLAQIDEHKSWDEKRLQCMAQAKK